MRIVRQPVRDGAAITLYDFEPTPERICDEVIRGLTTEPKQLPPKYLYDERGAELFERITKLDAYYPTRTEISILRRYAPEIARRIGRHVRLVEFGSGSGEKTWILLRHLENPVAYVPVDISCTQLLDFAASVARAFHDIAVTPVCADYTADFLLPPHEVEDARSVAFFPGSTIGNFEPAEARAFLGRVRTVLGANGGLLLGVDLPKDPAIIEHAYNDPEGVTAEFNLNLLARINRECGANFDLHGFRHRAFFDPAASRVEMRLVSQRDQTVHLHSDGKEIDVAFTPDEFITTEYSHKYTLDAFAELAADAGWSVSATWTDDRAWFAVMLLA